LRWRVVVLRDYYDDLWWVGAWVGRRWDLFTKFVMAGDWRLDVYKDREGNNSYCNVV
jgi:hypothetical protein